MDNSLIFILQGVNDFDEFNLTTQHGEDGCHGIKQQIPVGNYGNTDEGEDPFTMDGSAELPVKLELRYAIEAKRAEKGLDMPIIQDIHRRLPREVSCNVFT